MREQQFMTNESVFAGTSAGALGALVGCCDIDPEYALQALVDLSKTPTFSENIDRGLKQALKTLLPSDALERCNQRLFVTVTRLWPNPQLSPHIVSEFSSTEHLLSVVAASCFIPLYSAPKRIYTHIHHPRTASSAEYFIDGGVLAFMPPLGDVRMTPLPKHYIRARPIPDITLPDHARYPLPQLLLWVLKPAPEKDLRQLYTYGREAARTWMQEYKAGKVHLIRHNSHVNAHILYSQASQQQQQQQHIGQSILSSLPSLTKKLRAPSFSLQEPLATVLQKYQPKLPSSRTLHQWLRRLRR